MKKLLTRFILVSMLVILLLGCAGSGPSPEQQSRESDQQRDAERQQKENRDEGKEIVLHREPPSRHRRSQNKNAGLRPAFFNVRLRAALLRRNARSFEPVQEVAALGFHLFRQPAAEAVEQLLLVERLVARFARIDRHDLLEALARESKAGCMWLAIEQETLQMTPQEAVALA